MKTQFRLTPEDIKQKNEDSLELFYSGIKSPETRRTMSGNLKRFLVDVCAELLEGNYEQRAQQFVEIVKQDQQKATNMVLAYVRHLRQRTELAKTEPYYLNPSTLPNRVKPIKKLLDMNGLGLPWKRIYMSYPEMDNIHQGRGYTRDEIKKLLEYSNSISLDFIILASSSGGLRVGAWSKQTWGNVFPIYQIDGEYKIEIDDNDKGVIVCAAMRIYKGTPEEYYSLISLESWNKLQEYKKVWTRKTKRAPTEKDPLILKMYSELTALSDVSVRTKIELLLERSGVRTPLLEGSRRHEVPATHGFRRYWDKIMMQTQQKRGTLSALVIKERLMGHQGIVKTDKNYFWTDILELVPDYLCAMPELTINDEERLEKKLEMQEVENQRLTKIIIQEKKFPTLEELEASIAKIQQNGIKLM